VCHMRSTDRRRTQARSAATASEILLEVPGGAAPPCDAYLKAHYFGGLNRRFQVLTRMVRMTGLPRWYIKRQAARLGLTMKMDRRSWTEAELDCLENLVGRVSSATIAKRLRRPESSIVNKLKRLGTSRRVGDGYTMRELELCLGEDHHKIAAWIKNGWLVAGPASGYAQAQWKWQRYPSHP
jgi:hypothetical protein